MKIGYLPKIGLMLILLAFLCICGCISMQSPEITVQKISITNISLQQMTLRADIEITNPNSMEMEISDLDITVSYKDGDTTEKIGNGTYKSLKVPAKSSEKITIPIIVDNYDIIKTVLTFLKTGEMKILTTGSGHYKTMFVENSVAFTHEMSLSIDDVEISIKDTMQELIRTVQGTKNTLEKAKNLINPVKEGVGEIINIISNDSAMPNLEKS